MIHKRKHIPFSLTTNLYHKNTSYVQLHKCSNHYLFSQKAPLKECFCLWLFYYVNLYTIYCNCFVHFVLMWPFSISIWICNPVRIHGNKWYDMVLSKANLNSNGDRESPCFKPFLIETCQINSCLRGLCYMFQSDTLLLALQVSWGYQTLWEYYTGPPS